MRYFFIMYVLSWPTRCSWLRSCLEALSDLLTAAIISWSCREKTALSPPGGAGRKDGCCRLPSVRKRRCARLETLPASLFSQRDETGVLEKGTESSFLMIAASRFCASETFSRNCQIVCRSVTAPASAASAAVRPRSPVEYAFSFSRTLAFGRCRQVDRAHSGHTPAEW